MIIKARKGIGRVNIKERKKQSKIEVKRVKGIDQISKREEKKRKEKRRKEKEREKKKRKEKRKEEKKRKEKRRKE